MTRRRPAHARDRRWTACARLDRLTPDRGVAALVDGDAGRGVPARRRRAVRRRQRRPVLGRQRAQPRHRRRRRRRRRRWRRRCYKQRFDLRTGRVPRRRRRRGCARGACALDDGVVEVRRRRDRHVPVEIAPASRAARRSTASPTAAARSCSPLDAGEQYRFGFSMSACIGCHSLRGRVRRAERPARRARRGAGSARSRAATYPDTQRFHLSMSCNHCLDPACLEGCPTNAYEKLDNGVVAHHADDCIGCQYCTWNCPYSVPVFQPDRRIVTKCDMCLPRLEDGPARRRASAPAPPTRSRVEKVDVAAWRADHAAGRRAAPARRRTSRISTTRIELPADVPAETFAASDWNLQPEHPHWPLVWLTVAHAGRRRASAPPSATPADRLLAAGAGRRRRWSASLAPPRPPGAWPGRRCATCAARGCSREVRAVRRCTPALAAAAVVAAGARAASPRVVGVAGRVRVGPPLRRARAGPAWNSPLTVVRFVATGAGASARCSPADRGARPSSASAVALRRRSSPTGCGSARLGDRAGRGARSGSSCAGSGWLDGRCAGRSRSARRRGRRSAAPPVARRRAARGRRRADRAVAVLRHRRAAATCPARSGAARRGAHR